MNIQATGNAETTGMFAGSTLAVTVIAGRVQTLEAKKERGSSGTSASRSGNNHSENAGPAPNNLRAGLRASNTQARPNVASSNICNDTSIMTALLAFDPFDQGTQLGNILRAQCLAAGKMRQQWRDAAAEDAIQQAAALLRLPLLARQHRRILVASAIPLRAHRALACEPVQQRAHRVLVPAGGVMQGGGDVLGGLWRLPPQHIHHPAFGFADRWNLLGHE